MHKAWRASTAATPPHLSDMSSHTNNIVCECKKQQESTAAHLLLLSIESTPLLPTCVSTREAVHKVLLNIQQMLYHLHITQGPCLRCTLTECHRAIISEPLWMLQARPLFATSQLLVKFPFIFLSHQPQQLQAIFHLMAGGKKGDKDRATKRPSVTLSRALAIISPMASSLPDEMVATFCTRSTPVRRRVVHRAGGGRPS